MNEQLLLNMTFSILVFDPITNSFGGASATGNICVGAWVLRAEPFSGVSASQGADPSTLWGENVLRYSNKGMSAEAAITKTIHEDSGKDRRQISLIDKSGNGSVFSGMNNSPIIDEIVSENIVLSGNILSNKNVLASMKLAYEKNHDVELVERLYLSLLEGANAGGDRRGLFSASILVVNENKPPISLRVDYSKKPLKKLKKIIDKTNEKSYSNWLKFLPVISNPYNSEENKKS